MTVNTGTSSANVERDIAGSMELVVISLADAHGRRRKVRSLLDKTRLRWSIFDALTGPPNGVSYCEESAIARYGRALGQGELGCFGSHYACLNDFLKARRSQYRMVIEDDVLLDPGFPFYRLPGLMQTAGIDYLRLYSRSFPKNRVVMQLGQRYLIRFGTPPWGTQAYIVSREGAARLTQSIKSISRPVDDEFDRFWQHGLPSYALFPYPVMELESSTTIVKSKLDTTLLPARKRLLNYWSRGSEKARKECANLWLTFRDRDIERRLRCEPLSFLR